MMTEFATLVAVLGTFGSWMMVIVVALMTLSH